MRDARATAPPPVPCNASPRSTSSTAYASFPLYDFDFVEVDAENFMCDLRVGGFVPLAVRMGADVNLHFAISGQLDLRLLVSWHDRTAPRSKHRRAHGTLFDEEREADTDLATVAFRVLLARAYFGEADRFDRAPHAFGVIAAIEMLSPYIVERHLVGPYQVTQADLVRFKPGLVSDRVHDRFDGKTNAGSCDASIRNDRALVG